MVVLTALMMASSSWGFTCVFKGRGFPSVELDGVVEGIVEVDTTGWAESWGALSGRIKEGFEAIAKEVEATGGGNAIVVSHGMTITTLIYPH